MFTTTGLTQLVLYDHKHNTLNLPPSSRFLSTMLLTNKVFNNTFDLEGGLNILVHVVFTCNVFVCVVYFRREAVPLTVTNSTVLDYSDVCSYPNRKDHLGQLLTRTGA